MVDMSKHADLVLASALAFGLSALLVLCRSRVQIAQGRQRESDLRSTVDTLRQRDGVANEHAASLSLLNQELAHRYKNFLSMVQAIADRTLCHASDLASARVALSDRIFALGATTALLAMRDHASAPLDDVVRAIVDPQDTRIDCSGPPVSLPPRMALGMGLMLHELTTNAVKYGALSQAGGRVELRWSVQAVACDGGTAEGAATLHLSWRECDGPIVVPPGRSGFGTTLLQKAATAYFRGRGDLVFRPEGLVFLLEAPMPATAEE